MVKRNRKYLIDSHSNVLSKVSQHRDVIQNEYARVNVAKGKLENLCRELQRHSKAVAVSFTIRQELLESVCVCTIHVSLPSCNCHDKIFH